MNPGAIKDFDDEGVRQRDLGDTTKTPLLSKN